MFYVSKLIGLFINPILWVIVLLILSLITKKQLLKNRLLISSFSLLVLFSNPAIFNSIAGNYETDNSYNSELAYDYGIVLSGMIDYNKTTNKYRITRSADRIWQATDLYNNGYIKKILITGGKADVLNGDTIESVLLADFLKQTGIPESDILVETNARNTYENAIFTKKIIGNTDGNYLLITSGVHMNRSSKCFNKAGIPHDTYSTDSYSIKHKSFFLKLIPSANTMSNWKALLHEWFGLFYYKVRGYI